VENQPDAPNKTLGALTTPAGGGVSVLGGTKIYQHNGSTSVAFARNGNAPSNNGGTQTLGLGEAVLLQNVNAGAMAITFEGSVRERRQAIGLTSSQPKLWETKTCRSFSAGLFLMATCAVSIRWRNFSA